MTKQNRQTTILVPVEIYEDMAAFYGDAESQFIQWFSQHGITVTEVKYVTNRTRHILCPEINERFKLSSRTLLVLGETSHGLELFVEPVGPGEEDLLF